MDKRRKLAILMATYNGEKYLEEQIESILNQTYNNFTLYIRDDDSSDNTNRIIDKYIQEYPNKIVQIKDERIASSACKNFMYLLEHVYNLNEYELFMFADQDDVWKDNKVYETIKKYIEITDKEQPILIHTDLEVVDCNLDLINKSYMKYANLKSKKSMLNNYLIQNNVTGCTSFINKSLVDLVKFDIVNIRMHDWYFALLASVFGKIIFIDEATIKYRQHRENVIGAKKANSIKTIYRKIMNHLKKGIIKKDLNELFIQAESFKKHYYNLLDAKNKNIIDDFCRIKNSNKIKKILIINKNKFYKHGIIRIIGELIFI